MAKKFIIDQNSFKYGDVDMHYELMEQNSKVKGGGYWYIDDNNENLYLYGASADFGGLSLEQLKEAKNKFEFTNDLDKMNWVFSESFSLNDAFNSSIKF